MTDDDVATPTHQGFAASVAPARFAAKNRPNPDGSRRIDGPTIELSAATHAGSFGSASRGAWAHAAFVDVTDAEAGSTTRIGTCTLFDEPTKTTADPDATMLGSAASHTWGTLAG